MVNRGFTRQSYSDTQIYSTNFKNQNERMRKCARRLFLREAFSKNIFEICEILQNYRRQFCLIEDLLDKVTPTPKFTRQICG